MKKKFKFYPNSNQYSYKHYDYTISIDKDDFEKMSNLEVEEYVKNMLKQTKKPVYNDISSDEDIKNSFKRIRELLNFESYFNSKVQSNQ